jgi:hypothetical protein
LGVYPMEITALGFMVGSVHGIPKRMRKAVEIPLWFSCAVVAPARLDKGCAGGRYQRSTAECPDDKSAAAREKTVWLKDKMAKGMDIKVQTDEGFVQLGGFVNSLAPKVGRAQRPEIKAP